MRAFVVSTILILFVVLFWCFALRFTSNSTDFLLSIIEEDLVPAVLEGEWEDVDKSFGRFRDEWNKAQEKYTLYMSTSSVTDIDLSVSRLNGYIASQEIGLIAGELTSVVKHLERLALDQGLSLENLL